MKLHFFFFFQRGIAYTGNNIKKESSPVAEDRIQDVRNAVYSCKSDFVGMVWSGEETLEVSRFHHHVGCILS